jgi:hypothetical protein
MSEPVFQAHVIDRDVTDGYWIQAVDVDGDGRPDLLTSGLASGKVVWYRNPDWQKHLVHEFVRPVSLDQGDITGDGTTDLVVCHDYAETMFVATPEDGRVSWLRNPGPDAVEGTWEVYPIGQLGSTHRLRLGHFTGLSSLELLAAPVVGPLSGADALHAPVRVTLYQRPDDVLAAGPWPSQVLDDENYPVVHGIALGNYGAPSPPGLDATILASAAGLAWFGVDGTGAWRGIPLAEGEQEEARETGYKGSGNVAVGRIGDDPFAYVVAVEPFHGDTLALYTRTGGEGVAGATWSRRVLERFPGRNDAGEGPAHHVVCADFDGDGDDEFLVALRGPMPEQGVFHYRPVDLAAGRVAKTRVSEPSAARIAVADFDGDGRLDFATTGYHVPGYFECEDPQVALFLNRFGRPVEDLPTIPRGPLGG